ncbi:MAG: type II toxin-antitoxin system ParD family antitoxin [Archangium gephyra]|uniref:Type II toxin-antitoxin system ParD family antitoxin n=1 Tax=Archangium gephyra TaxID=48 RepID=A0A2W5TM77_9BACT|nr:MAG: type II toxin-antitoxin system ParD family antitoxin [Archangium gephyra]
MKRTTSYTLSAENAVFLKRQVEAGTYRSASDVVRAALTRMEEEQRKEEAVLAALDEGLASGRARPGAWKRVRAAVKRKTP